MSLLLACARRAFDTIPLYRALYGRRPDSEAEIPFLPVSAFHRAAAPTDLAAANDMLRGIVPAYSRNARALPVVALESEAEWRLRLDRFRHALDVLGAGPQAGLHFAVVADEASGPFASDIANFLAWDRAECSAIFQWDDPAIVATTLAAVAPDVVILTGAGIAFRDLAPRDAILIACLHADASFDGFVGMDRLLVSDELFVIGAARRGETNFAYDDRSVLLEADPASGLLAVTTVAFDSFALVRRCVGLPYPVAGAHAGL